MPTPVRKSVMTDWDMVTKCVYTTLGDIRTEMIEAQRMSTPLFQIALDALDGLKQFINAIELDMGAN